MGEASNNLAEMHALFTGLLLCYQLDIRKIYIETDSQLLVNWLMRAFKPPWRLLDLWNKIVSLVAVMEIQISHIYREGNAVADSLAKQGAKGISATYFRLSELLPETTRAWIGDELKLPVWRHPRV